MIDDSIKKRNANIFFGDADRANNKSIDERTMVAGGAHCAATPPSSAATAPGRQRVDRGHSRFGGRCIVRPDTERLGGECPNQGAYANTDSHTEAEQVCGLRPRGQILSIGEECPTALSSQYLSDGGSLRQLCRAQQGGVPALFGRQLLSARIALQFAVPRRLHVRFLDNEVHALPGRHVLHEQCQV